MRKGAVALAVMAFVAIACAPSEPQAAPEAVRVVSGDV